ncbi:hypothetical protein [Moorena producens]|uniref:hypothetical protein n=1 Tax=Moorena producens TaxID=1155739 RepID=UPI003C7356E9
MAKVERVRVQPANLGLWPRYANKPSNSTLKPWPWPLATLREWPRYANNPSPLQPANLQPSTS